MEGAGEYKQAWRHLRRGGNVLQQDVEKLHFYIQREEPWSLNTNTFQTSYILMPLPPLFVTRAQMWTNSVHFVHLLSWTKFQSWQLTWNGCHNSLIKVKLTNWYGHAIQHHTDIWDFNYSWLSIRIPSFQPFIIGYSKMWWGHVIGNQPLLISCYHANHSQLSLSLCEVDCSCALWNEILLWSFNLFYVPKKRFDVIKKCSCFTYIVSLSYTFINAFL